MARSLVLGALVALVVGACAAGAGDGSSQTSGPPEFKGPIIVTFEVAGDERFKALLVGSDEVEIAQRLFAGEDAPGIPNGLVVRDPGVNEGWSWSLDPADLDFVDETIEGCDGLPSDVETGSIASPRYCPWSAIVVEIVPAP